ncbi:MAG: hypothetical protein LBI27_00935 [Clostridiales bacterium]|jgi:hypothetical protein|nr:hypothetical protein [Clostridiales bacterium]
MKKNLQTEIKKLREMNFAEKRWYIWEYYKFHIGGLIVLFFIMVSIINSILNPKPDEYLYIAWLNIPAQSWQIEELARGLSVITEDPERQAVTITNYSETQDTRINAALETRFNALLLMGAMDVLITTREGVEAVFEIEEDFRFIRSLDEISQIYLTEERALLIEGEIFAISLEGSPLLEYYEIDSSDAYLCVIINTERFFEIAKTLEVFLNDA